MKARAFEIDAEQRLIPILLDQVAEDCRKDDARIWLDLEGDDPDEGTVWLDRLGIRGLALGSMALVAISMFLFLRKGGWFGKLEDVG